MWVVVVEVEGKGRRGGCEEEGRKEGGRGAGRGRIGGGWEEGGWKWWRCGFGGTEEDEERRVVEKYQ